MADSWDHKHKTTHIRQPPYALHTGKTDKYNLYLKYTTKYISDEHISPETEKTSLQSSIKK